MNIKLSYGTQQILVECPKKQKTNITQLFKNVRNNHPDLYQHWCDKDGRVKHSIQVFVNGQHIRYLNGMKTELTERDQIYVIPLLAGG